MDARIQPKLRGPYRKHLYENADEGGSVSISRYSKKLLLQNKEDNIDQEEPSHSESTLCSSELDGDEPMLEHPGQEVGIDGIVVHQQEEVQAPEVDVQENESSSDSERDNVEFNYEPNKMNGFDKLKSYLGLQGNKNHFVVNYSCAEILFMVITIALAHNLTLNATCDILAMLNVLLNTDILPSTQFIVKSLLNPNLGLTFHYCCQYCGHYLGTKEQIDSVATCKNSECLQINNITGYVYENTFVTLDLHIQFKDILENQNIKFEFPDNESYSNNNTYSDFYSGSMYRVLIQKFGLINFLTCLWNSDGAPVAKCSRSEITPIFLMVNEITYRQRSDNMILAGLWFGKSKPRMDVFLEPFTIMMNRLGTEGVTFMSNGEVKTIKVFACCCCVDTVARAPMQGIKGVGGYNCCSWCEIRGTIPIASGTSDVNRKGKNPVKYPVPHKEPNVRTEDTFKANYMSYVESGLSSCGVQSVSPLINLNNFNMVWGFVPDALHCIMLGVCKRLLLHWTSKVGTVSYIGSPANIKLLDSLIENITPPTYLKRNPVKISDKKFMKGREFENWLLFYSIPVLQNLLPLPYFNHWKMFVHASYLLLKDSVSKEEVNKAELLYVEFIFKIRSLYGEFECTYNVHQLNHMAESVRRWGPLWCHTAYVFEYAIGTIKRILKTTRGVPQQISRNLEFYRARSFILNNANIDENVLNFCEKVQKCRVGNVHINRQNENLFHQFGQFTEYHYVINLPPGNYFEYSKLVLEGVTFESSNFCKKIKNNNNCYVQKLNEQFCHIVNIILNKDTQRIYFVVKNLIVNNIAGVVHIKKIQSHSGAKHAVNIDEIYNIAVYINVGNGNEYNCICA